MIDRQLKAGTITQAEYDAEVYEIRCWMIGPEFATYETFPNVTAEEVDRAFRLSGSPPAPTLDNEVDLILRRANQITQAKSADTSPRRLVTDAKGVVYEDVVDACLEHELATREDGWLLMAEDILQHVDRRLSE